jgi:hypothetical protein
MANATRTPIHFIKKETEDLFNIKLCVLQVTLLLPSIIIFYLNERCYFSSFTTRTFITLYSSNSKFSIKNQSIKLNCGSTYNNRIATGSTASVFPLIKSLKSARHRNNLNIGSWRLINHGNSENYRLMIGILKNALGQMDCISSS